MHQQGNWREVLIVTGGMTPQVVTETVYALATRENDRIVPAKIVCVVTGSVADRFGEPLEVALDRLRGQLGVSADWTRRLTVWHSGRDGLFVEYPRHADDSPVRDIRSDEEAVRFADFVSEVVRTETFDPQARVHLSLAGGRKTMSFHGGAAMSLFARLHDQLSHVLVHPQEFEGAPGFWFPTRQDEWVAAPAGPRASAAASPGKKLNAKDARIELGRIPFLRMRDQLPPWVMEKKLDYASYVAQAQAASMRSQLELVTSDCLVRIVGVVEFELPNREFALYQLMAEWCRARHAGAGLNGVGREHEGWLTPGMLYEPQLFRPNAVARYLDIYQETFRVGTERAEHADVYRDTRSVKKDPKDRSDEELLRKEQNRRYFDPVKSGLVKKLQQYLHIPELADRFGAPLKPRRPNPRFGLNLAPDEIVIREL